ncbi:MAG: DUF4340 domain-containing protein [Treponema sp.]|nr:DUF4340 domain-containing protein [Treponema sp.]
MSKNKILLIITGVLLALYLISFTKSCSMQAQDKREKIKTALVNPKNKKKINQIELSDSTGSLCLVNQNGFWQILIQNNAENQALTFPAAKERIENLIENLIKVRNLYKISDKINKNSSLGLTNGTEFYLRYCYDEGFHELIFGNQDFSLSARYLMTDKNTQVYETDNGLDVYLTTSLQSWAEPYLVSKNVFGSKVLNDIQKISVIKNENGKKTVSSISDFQKFLDLRHGGIATDVFQVLQTENNSENVMKINVELGNKDFLELEFFGNSQDFAEGNAFLVKTQYFKSSSEKAFYTSYSKISSWTYNKINEMTL